MPKNTIFNILISVLIFSQSACNNPVDSPYPPLVWEQKANFPDGGRSSASATSIGDKAYIFFGRNASGVYQNDCWEYDSTNDSWTQKSSCPGVERVKTISATFNGKIYAGLGYNGEGVYDDDNYLKDFWEYDPENDTWTEKTSAPFSGTDACITFLYEDEIYVGIGFNIYFGEEWWKYSPKNDEWEQLNKFHAEPRFGSVSCTGNGRIFFGTGHSTYNLNDWWEYSPANDSWGKRKKMPDKGRVNAVSLCVQNRFFVATGLYFRGTLSGGGVKSDILEYDADRDVWYDSGDIPGPARDNAIAFTIDGKGYIGLGENDSNNNIMSDLICFEP